MSEEEIIKRNLILDGDGTGDNRRLNVLVKMITKWINTLDESDEEINLTYDKIVAQLALLQHARRRSDLVHKQTSNQLIKYQQLHLEMEQNITTIKENIEKQKLELEKAKTIKQNRIQYDLLAKAIDKEPARTEMIKNLNNLQKQLAELTKEKKELELVLDCRKKQFMVLSTSVNALQALLSDDNRFSMDESDHGMVVIDETMSE